jgi:hypothetical protein
MLSFQLKIAERVPQTIEMIGGGRLGGRGGDKRVASCSLQAWCEEGGRSGRPR